MRKLIACIALVVLSSCINVEDVGEVWARGTIDPALEGTWAVSGSANPQSKERESWRIVKQGDMYRVEPLYQGNTSEPSLARTIEVDHKKFLLIKSQKDSSALLLRYEVQEGRILHYGLKSMNEVRVWLQKTHPDQQQIEWASKDMFGTSMQIKTLDMHTLGIIASMPQWSVAGYFHKR